MLGWDREPVIVPSEGACGSGNGAVGEPRCRGGPDPGQTPRRRGKSRDSRMLDWDAPARLTPFPSQRPVSRAPAPSPCEVGIAPRRDHPADAPQRLDGALQHPPSYDISRVTRHLARTARMVNCALHNGKRGCHFPGFATHSGQTGRPPRTRAASRAGPATRSPSAQAHGPTSPSGLPSRRLLWAPRRRPDRHGCPSPGPGRYGHACLPSRAPSAKRAQMSDPHLKKRRKRP